MLKLIRSFSRPVPAGQHGSHDLADRGKVAPPTADALAGVWTGESRHNG
jgi:hypothetical protein